MKFSGNYVQITNDKKSFDWAGFKNAVNSYNGDDLTFDKFKTTTIARSEGYYFWILSLFSFSEREVK